MCVCVCAEFTYLAVFIYFSFFFFFLGPENGIHLFVAIVPSTALRTWWILS